MSLFIDLTFRHPNREASSEQFLAVLPLQLQKDTYIFSAVLPLQLQKDTLALPKIALKKPPGLGDETSNQ